MKGKPQADSESLSHDFRTVVTGESIIKNEDTLGELQLLEGVQHFPQRVKCAMLGWRALEQGIQMRTAGADEGTTSSED